MMHIRKAADIVLELWKRSLGSVPFTGPPELCGVGVAITSLTRVFSVPGQTLSPLHCALSALSWCAFSFPWLQDYYSGGYYPVQDPTLVPPQEIASDASFIDDEAVS